MAREITMQNMRAMLKCMFRASNEHSIRKTANVLGYKCARAFFGQNWSSAVRDLSVKFNQKFTVIAECFEKQCSFLAVQRMRRAAQFIAFYNRLYGEKLIDQMGGPILRRLQNKPLLFLIGATLFSWEEQRITDDELNRCVYDMAHIQELIQRTAATQPVQPPCEWEKIIDRPHLVVWRRPLEFNESLFQYKVYGRFDDVPARAFFNTQVDLEFWKQWDKLSLDIKIIDKHENSGSEVVHWTSKYPYPMYSRDYVYVRRYKENAYKSPKEDVYSIDLKPLQVDPHNKFMAMYSRTVSHPSCPVQDNIVRVTDYQSALVIHPLKDFDENGFQYVLTYYDDPQTTFPTVCYNWMATTGVPDFVEKLHKAAKMMHERTQKGYRPAYYQNQNQNNSHFSMSRSQYA